MTTEELEARVAGAEAVIVALRGKMEAMYNSDLEAGWPRDANDLQGAYEEKYGVYLYPPDLYKCQVWAGRGEVFSPEEYEARIGQRIEVRGESGILRSAAVRLEGRVVDLVIERGVAQ